MLTITIELRIDFDTKDKKEREPIIIQKSNELANELLTVAELLAGKRKPQISVQAGDFFSTTEDVRKIGHGES